jgi:hypothetical protein
MASSIKRWTAPVSVLIGLSLLAPLALASPGIEVGGCNVVGRGTDITSVAVADFDGDGDEDIVSGDDEGDAVVVWENDGTPFAGGWLSQTVGTRNVINAVAVGDFDGVDGPDIVSVDEDNAVVVWKNDGTPFDDTWDSQVVGTRGDDINDVAVGDFDGNGDLDIVSGDYEHAVVIWRNDGTPFSGGWNSQVVGSKPNTISSVAVGDFNGDEDLDIVCGDEDNEITVWENDGTPFNDGWARQVVGTGGPIEEEVEVVAVGDFEGDGDPDIASGDASSLVLVWENDGSPFSGGWISQTVGTRSEAIESLAVGDLDCNGTLDIVSGDEDYDVIVWENDGTPFDGGWAHQVVAKRPQEVNAVALGDLDGDYDLDIVSGDEEEEGGYVMACENLAQCGPPVGGAVAPIRGFEVLLSWLKSVFCRLR